MITEELREWFEHAYSYTSYDKSERKFEKIPNPWFGWKCVLERMLDRIDAEHKRDCDDAWDNGYEADYLGIENWLIEHPQVMEQHGWVRLPKDADGEYIHVGDEMDGYGKTIEVVELRIGRSGWVIVSRDGNAYADTFAFTHHKPPTVEGLLTEMVAKVIERGDLSNGAAQTIAEYAAKLQLKEDE